MDPSKFSPIKVWLFLFATTAILTILNFGFKETATKNKENFKTPSGAIESFKKDYSGFSTDSSKISKHENLNLTISKSADTTVQISEKSDASLYSVNSTGIQAIEGNDSLLDTFFNKLGRASSELVRILHFGDSQIEGDRISSVIREEFQKKAGGNGPGIVPLKLSYGSLSIVVKTSPNWVYHTFLYSGDSIKQCIPWALNGNAFYYQSNHEHLPAENLSEKAHVRFKTSRIAYPGARNFETFRFFYSSLPEDLPIVLHHGKQVVFDTLKATEKLQVYKKSFAEKSKEIKLSFFGNKSPVVYAASLEGNRGIVLDNLPIRGSSGLEFTKFNGLVNRELLQHLNPSLVIVQFGVNVVPNLTVSYLFYEKSLYRQLLFLKQTLPHSSILLVGLSDMARNAGGTLESYPNIEQIKQAQRNAAFKAGCPFWDLHAAMGGTNSMVNWVNQKPPLAQKDYTHFNQKGSERVGHLLFNAIWSEYEEFVKRGKKAT